MKVKGFTIQVHAGYRPTNVHTALLPVVHAYTLIHVTAGNHHTLVINDHYSGTGYLTKYVRLARQVAGVFIACQASGEHLTLGQHGFHLLPVVIAFQ